VFVLARFGSFGSVWFGLVCIGRFLSRLSRGCEAGGGGWAGFLPYSDSGRHIFTQGKEVNLSPR